MADKQFNGVFIEIVPGEDQSLEFRCGYSFPEDSDPEMVDYYRTMVAGIFGIISTHPDDLISVGEIVRTVSDFDVPPAPDDDPEIAFDPDNTLLERLGSEKVIDLTNYKFDPKKKH